MGSVSRLTRIRWAVRAVLALGVAASVTANVLHADPNPISQTIAGWPPIALLLTVELISRIPIHRRGLAAVRIGATAVIAGIAAWVSYWHMAGVAGRYGETGAAAYLLPLSVDGLIVVASVCLVELGGHLAATSRTPASRAPGDRATATAPTPPDPVAAASAHDMTPVRVPARTTVTPARDAIKQSSATAFRPLPPSAPTDAPRAAVPSAPRPPSPSSTMYTPTSDDDAAMYELWRRGVAEGREPSGVDLARAAGRSNDANGVGRKAARRYREAHAHASASTSTTRSIDAHTGSAAHNGTTGRWQHNGRRPDGAAA
jgi:uncharacterized protein DUF2637